MRNKKRIPLVLKAFERKEVKEAYIKFAFGTNYIKPEIIDELIKKWVSLEKEIKDYWSKNCDLRLSQVLISLDVLPNYPGFWFYEEETNWLVNTKFVEGRDILCWGQRYNASLKPIGHTKWILIKDLDTSHIENIIKDSKKQLYNVKQLHLETMEKELLLRQNKNNGKLGENIENVS